MNVKLEVLAQKMVSVKIFQVRVTMLTERLFGESSNYVFVLGRTPYCRKLYLLM